MLARRRIPSVFLPERVPIIARTIGRLPHTVFGSKCLPAKEKLRPVRSVSFALYHDGAQRFTMKRSAYQLFLRKGKFIHRIIFVLQFQRGVPPSRFPSATANNEGRGTGGDRRFRFSVRLPILADPPGCVPGISPDRRFFPHMIRRRHGTSFPIRHRLGDH